MFKNTQERTSFRDNLPVMDVPNLLDVQLDSYHDFLQENISPEKRKNRGLQAVFNSIFPVEDGHNNFVLEFVNYTVGLPRYSVNECLNQGVSYTVPLKVQLRLHILEEGTKKGEIAETIEREVFFGNIPYMTRTGSFVINGAERVIVSQLQRSPGVFFDIGTHPNGTKLYTARIIPFRGSWIDFTTDINDCLFTIIDRRKKFPITTLLRAIGYPKNSDILKLFKLFETVKLKSFKPESGITYTLAEDAVNEETGEIFYEAGDDLSENDIESLKGEKGIRTISIINIMDEVSANLIMNTLKKDETKNAEEALFLIYRNLRGGQPPNFVTAQKFVERLFFSPKKYDLGEVGRYRINKKFGLHIPVENRTLTQDDILIIINYLVEMRKGLRGKDDIDHLGNRRVRTVGEQLAGQFMVALSRMQRTARDRMNIRELENLTPSVLINSRILTSVLNTFFGTSQMSQFMDQTNPLAELTHKRRLSALGPGGLERERAGFEVRDVHHTHYGRLCPIETPEGPNIGLISSLAVYARVNRLGFIETPYRKVVSGRKGVRVTDEIEFLSADDEDREIIAQANAGLSNAGYFEENMILTRIKDDYLMVSPKKIKYMDVSPGQILSAAASLIPFLEHDDANRVLMGSNMQRQSVPLLKPTAPIVGTGFETSVARDSGATVIAKNAGEVIEVDSSHIIVKTFNDPDDLRLSDKEGLDVYDLARYVRTNQDTVVNQRPIVHEGQKVEPGDLLADGSSTSHGELALGQNIRVAFMPWRGYNFEDAIIISERLIRDDVFTSVHVKEYTMEVRDTKRGDEELTREIPNVSEEATRDLDENGIVRVGAEVVSNSILIGKVTPKGESDPTPEEKLLLAIFGEKAGEVKDASKRLKNSNGIVIDTKLFERTSKRSGTTLKKIIDIIEKKFAKRLDNLKEKQSQVFDLLLGGQVSGGIRNAETGSTILKAGTHLNAKRLANLDIEKLSRLSVWTKSQKINKKVNELLIRFDKMKRELDQKKEQEIFKSQVGDELQPGVNSLAKVFVAQKRKVQVGDKMAGRHGNKGVVAAIVPQEDMPHLEDGTPMDIILNPLGVPSRMNVGQLYETMLGRAGEILGKIFSTPVFDGASLEQVQQEMTNAGINQSGKEVLYDGMTGEPFEQSVTIGVMYMMKLAHMIEDKMHSRSTGPYSLITQQPLGGKAQFGGQRFGEMEVWALEGYGAAHTLREMLTIKSDDIDGRSKAYNALVKGANIDFTGIPESLKVLRRELQGLCLELDME